MKFAIALAFLAILVALVTAWARVMRAPRGEEDTRPKAHPKPRMVTALAIRVALSIAVFALVLMGWALGWIQPTGIPRH